MNVKYSIFRCAIATTGVCAALLLATACTDDDFGHKNQGGKQIAFNIIAPGIWHDGMEINENEPTTHCLSVKELSGDGDSKLYLHTVVADNPVEKTMGASRGALIRDLTKFKEKYTRFSLSGICYSGDYPEDESQNTWTTEYAHDLYFSTDDCRQLSGAHPLLWPYNDKVRFFAFAPTTEDFKKLNTGGTLTLSGSDSPGSPTLTYTVPADVEKQIDLMTANTGYNFSPTSTKVDLKFGHALTAVRIACGGDMLAGTISKVEISGIYGSGTQVIGSDTWDTSGASLASYTISKEIKLPADNSSDDTIHAGNGTAIAGDSLTFILMPQTLPKDASITIVFTDEASKTERTITGSIAGQTWEAGKIITYSVSPSSIHINASVDIGKKGSTDENPTGAVMPYSGVWYDVKYSPAKVEIVQAGVDTKEIAEIPVDKIKFKYKLEDSETDEWSDCTTDAGGLLQIDPQPAYATMREGFDITTEAGSEASPVSLTVNSKTANCYLVDEAGYFSLPLVYGNGNVADPVENTKSLNYYPKHDDGRMPADGKIAGAYDAVLCWQDAPDLIDPASVKIVGENLVFHIRKQTITQGNALLAVRNASKDIIWSWHIWVTPYKDDFYTQYHNISADGYFYDLAKYNLGWCDSHDHNEARKFSLRAVVDMTVYGGEKETPIEIGTFTLDVFKGSKAGDNTYYQWGRKDPMLGGIYNELTPEYKYKKKGATVYNDFVEFTMENKQVFNQYNKDGDNYSFCKNPGDMIASYGPIGTPGEASKGVTIGYAIQHPYMFVTNSKEHGTSSHTGFNYRNHWHIPYADKAVAYLDSATHIMFNAWNSAATDAGRLYPVNADSLEYNAEKVTKSVYDPCPPEFQIPPIHAFQAINTTATKTHSGNKWVLDYNGQSIEFPLTGVRDYALRENEYKTVVLNTASTTSNFDYTAFYKTSMPAF